ncbi:MAG: hypothetical protein DRI57_32000 [Deltaproteobacteria bacterium]|nr:MAG: hypothetical protein DRI57_32000 [Deltaproteobacteria bacterium]
MFCELNLKNFKAYERLSIELKPLTFLLGPNNSGKSSILAALRLLHQTVKSRDRSVSLLLNGVMGEFGTYKDIVHGNNTRKQINIRCGIMGGDFASGTDVLSIDLKYKYRPSLKELILKRAEICLNDDIIMVTRYAEDTERRIIQKIADYEIPPASQSSLSKGFETMNFLPFPLASSLKQHDELPEFKESISKIFMINRVAVSAFHNMEYIGAMRIPPSRIYLFSGEKRDRVGPSGENCINMLTMYSMKKDSQSKNIFKKVTKWLKQACIASDLKIIPLSDHRYFELRIQHPQTEEYQNLADIGYGHSQILPVLVGGYHLNKGSTFLAEEPEIHLHPISQAELGDFFSELYENGVQSLVETHSEYMILRLQQHVAQGRIPPEDIVFYYVYANNGKKVVVRLNLDKRGRFLEEWPEGFFPERLEEAKKLSKIRFRN